MSNHEKTGMRMSREQRRTQLIEVALDVFAQRGFAQTTMDEVARQASVSKPVLYQHFQNKRDLYFTLLDSQFQTLRNTIISRMESVDSQADNADEQTAYQAVYGVFEFTTEPRGHYRLILDTSMEDPAELEQRKARFLDELVDFISPYILEHSILDDSGARFITAGIASTVMYLACRWAEEDRNNTAAHPSIPVELAVEHTYRLIAHGALGFDRANNPSA